MRTQKTNSKSFAPAAFPTCAMRFLGKLAQNNSSAWFQAHRAEYQTDLVEPLRDFIGQLGARLRGLNPNLDVSYKVNTTVMRINRDMRFNPNGAPYREYVKVSFPILGFKWSTDPVLGFGVFPDYFYVAFRNAGDKRGDFVANYFNNLRRHEDIVQRWLDSGKISRRFSVLGGKHDRIEPVAPCPAKVVELERDPEPTFGRVWSKAEVASLGDEFSKVVGEELSHLYFLKLLAISNDIPRDSAAYFRAIGSKRHRAAHASTTDAHASIRF